MTSNLVELIGLYDEHAPLESAKTIPSAWYTEPAILALEQRAVFGRSWIAAGRADQVEAPGQYFTTDLAGEPLLVVRGADRELRAFFNVCRHHAAAVAPAGCGTAQLFRCPYHGWTYASDGLLKGTPDFAGVCDFDRKENGLVPVRVDAWEQFVFVCMDPSSPPLDDFLGAIKEQTSALNFASLRFYERREYTLNCNWKVFVDNYLDGGYHVPYIHKALNSVLEYSEYTIENGARFCLQSSPIAASDDHADVTSTRRGNRAYYYWLYPNFMINFYDGVMDTNLVLPLGVDRTLVIFDFFFNDSSGRTLNDQSVAVSDRIQEEDVEICESVQRGLRSRAYSAGRLSVRREAGEHLFHRLLARDLKAELG